MQPNPCIRPVELVAVPYLKVQRELVDLMSVHSLVTAVAAVVAVALEVFA